MTKLNAIFLAAGIGADVSGEINDLEALMEIGVEKAKEIKHQFNHINSLLTGMQYVIDYIEDEEAQKELKEIIDRQREFLMSDRRQCMEIVYSAKLGRKVTIKADAPGTYALSIAGTETEGGHIIYGLKDMDAVKEAFIKEFDR